MKILVVSDSHGSKESINKLLKCETYDYLFFLGDGISDFGDNIKNPNSYFVKGNCDFFSTCPTVQLQKVKNVSFLLTHGQFYHAKFGLKNLISLAKALQVKCVLFGHTHSRTIEEHDGIKFINPGAFCGKNKNYMIITVKNDKILINDKTLKGE